MGSKTELQPLEKTAVIVKEFSNMQRKIIELKIRNYNLNSISKLYVSKLKKDSFKQFKLVSVDTILDIVINKKVYISNITDTSYTYIFPKNIRNCGTFGDQVEIEKKIEDYTFHFNTLDDSPHSSRRLQDYQKTWYLFEK